MLEEALAHGYDVDLKCQISRWMSCAVLGETEMVVAYCFLIWVACASERSKPALQLQ